MIIRVSIQDRTVDKVEKEYFIKQPNENRSPFLPILHYKSRAEPGGEALYRLSYQNILLIVWILIFLFDPGGRNSALCRSN